MTTFNDLSTITITRDNIQHPEENYLESCLYTYVDADDNDKYAVHEQKLRTVKLSTVEKVTKMKNFTVEHRRRRCLLCRLRQFCE